MVSLAGTRMIERSRNDDLKPTPCEELRYLLSHQL
jgi:hypothetical protein